MEQTEVEAMIRRLIEREGGYVDHPNDVGGCTKYGVIRATLEDHRRRPTTCADVKALAIEEAIQIYERLWFDHPGLRLRQWPYRKLAEVTLDAAIMFGGGRAMAVRWVQEAINDRLKDGRDKLVVDGLAGPKTLFAMVGCDQQALVAAVIARRILKHGRVVAAAPSQAVFLNGWLNRATKWIM